MSSKGDPIYLDRELSWLSFNARVLQEAQDPAVPLLERLGFLAIYSSNLDEFFRVRVASLRSLLRLKQKTLDKLEVNPARLLRQIHAVVTAQQEAFGQIFRGEILPALAQHRIHLIDERGVTEVQSAHLRSYFDEHIRPRLQPERLALETEPPFLKDRHLYLVTELWPAQGPHVALEGPHYALTEIPTGTLPRFVTVPGEVDACHVLFLDDVVRLNLPALFPEHEVGASFAVKLSRDAELYLDDSFSDNLIEQIRKSLKKRETGLPCRFLYDMQAPYAMVTFLKTCFGLEDEDLLVGGRYHNLHDLSCFPHFGLKKLAYPALPPQPHPVLAAAPSLFAAVAERDHLLHVPYQAFAPVVRFLQEAADDPAVEEVWITLYRVAADSDVVQALLRAAARGKRVTAFVEVKARFDEASNVEWLERMEQAGIRTIHHLPGVKVHAKMALVRRREDDAQRWYAYLSTGNFNEKTARVYADSALFTADPRLADEVRRVFAFLAGEAAEPAFEHLLVAPLHLRKALYRLINREIKQARAGQPAGIVLKMNSLEDDKIIARLYKASRTGVPIRLLVRGICRLVPGVPGLSETIEVRSIVDRFLEHARVYWFHNAGQPRCYLASADWMRRNLSHRVEVAFPIYDAALQDEVRTLLDLQWADNTKARRLDGEQQNAYVRDGQPPVRAQLAARELFRQRTHGAVLLDGRNGSVQALTGK